jgi:hypothetical protein
MNRITYEEALQTLSAMFSHLDTEVITMILEANGSSEIDVFVIGSTPHSNLGCCSSMAIVLPNCNDIVFVLSVCRAGLVCDTSLLLHVDCSPLDIAVTSR